MIKVKIQQLEKEGDRFMINAEQHLRMLEKLSDILKALPNSKNINEVSKKTNIPTSTIQRYLNRKDLILELTNYDIKLTTEILEKIHEWLKKAKKEGNQKGGVTSQTMYHYSKDKYGKFNGNKRK